MAALGRLLHLPPLRVMAAHASRALSRASAPPEKPPRAPREPREPRTPRAKKPLRAAVREGLSHAATTLVGVPPRATLREELHRAAGFYPETLITDPFDMPPTPSKGR